MAVESTGWRERLSIPASFASMLLMGVAVSLLGPSLPGIALRTGVPLASTAVLFPLFAGGSLAATLGLARLLDRPARHAIMAAGSLLLAVALWAAAGASSLAWIGLTLALAGFGMSSTGIVPNVLVVQLYQHRAPSVLNALHMVAGIGSFLGPLLVGQAVQRGGDYAAVFLMLGAGEVLAALAWLVARPPLPQPGARGLPVFSFRLPRPILALVVLALLYVGAEQIIGGWLFSYSGQVANLDAAAAGAATSTFWLAIIAGRLLASQALRRISATALLFAGVLVGGAGVGLVLLANTWALLLWPGVALAGLSLGPIFPTTLAAATRATPARAGVTSSLLVAAGSAGAMLLPWASAGLIPLAGLTGSIAAAELPLILMLVCLFAFTRGYRGGGR